MMLNKTGQRRMFYFRRLFILPLGMIVMPLFAFKVNHEDSKNNSSQVRQQEHANGFDKEEFALFPGGITQWKKYLERNADLRVLAEHNAPAGKYSSVIVFTVNTNGTLSDITAETKGGYGTAEESIRLIGKSVKWQPATKDGVLVESKVKQTVTFELLTLGTIVYIDAVSFSY